MSDRPTRYALRVNLTIVRQEWTGPSTPDGAPMLDEDRPGYWRETQERLSVEESMNLEGLDFMGVMGTLGKMHEAIEAIKPQ